MFGYGPSLCRCGAARIDGARRTLGSFRYLWVVRIPRLVGSAAGLDQRPVATLDLQHPERRKIETEVIGRRHRHDSSRSDEAFRLLDLVAQLAGIGRVR